MIVQSIKMIVVIQRELESALLGGQRSRLDLREELWGLRTV